MANVKFYLDKRSPKKDRTCPVKLYITHNHTNTTMSTNVYVLPQNWDEAASKIIAGPQKDAFNNYLVLKIAEVTKAIAEIPIEKLWKMKTARQIKNFITGKPTEPNDERGSFAKAYKSFTERHDNKRTREIYEATWHMIDKYDPHAASLSFEDINKAWLDKFFVWLAQSSPSVNARNIHLRNIRAAFNDALDNELTNLYPFRRYKIRPVATVKRNLPPDIFYKVVHGTYPEYQQKYIDLFYLSFLLIGINMADLLSLRPIDYVNGRIMFNRRKTKRLYSIKVEPEAAALIEKYKGNGEHLICCADNCADYRHFTNRMNFNLKDAYPGLTTYYARHSWATYASELDIPHDTIAAALGHGGNTVTDIYIEFDSRKIDEANRKVIDYLNSFRS